MLQQKDTRRAWHEVKRRRDRSENCFSHFVVKNTSYKFSSKENVLFYKFYVFSPHMWDVQSIVFN